MTSISHEPSHTRLQRLGKRDLLVTEMWASLAIGVMWMAAFLDAIFGPDIVTSSAGGDHSTIPSGVVFALFAFLGTWVLARHGFNRDRNA
jgi:hypothetical protein